MLRARLAQGPPPCWGHGTGSEQLWRTGKRTFPGKPKDLSGAVAGGAGTALERAGPAVGGGGGGCARRPGAVGAGPRPRLKAVVRAGASSVPAHLFLRGPGCRGKGGSAPV